MPIRGDSTLDRWTILTGLVFVFLSGYFYEVWPYDGDYGFPYNSEIRINKRWYIFILMKDFRDVVLAWLLWKYGIPKSSLLLKRLGMIVCLLLTMIPVNFVLFYHPPFKPAIFIMKTVTTILITLIYYQYGNIDNNKHRVNH